jgi:hypothetical protein
MKKKLKLHQPSNKICTREIIFTFILSTYLLKKLKSLFVSSTDQIRILLFTSFFLTSNFIKTHNSRVHMWPRQSTNKPGLPKQPNAHQQAKTEAKNNKNKIAAKPGNRKTNNNKEKRVQPPEPQHQAPHSPSTSP